MSEPNSRDITLWLEEVVYVAEECNKIVCDEMIVDVRTCQGLYAVIPNDKYSDKLKKLNELIQNLLAMDKTTRKDCDVK